MTLSGPERAAASGTADSLVILLHGYGADGNDLIGLAEPLAQYLPNATFLAPNAPEPCGVNPMGYQWFPIPHMDGSSQGQSIESMKTSAAALDGWLDTVAEDTGIGPERTVLVGFSQGTMMSLHVALRRETPVAGIVGFSGRLLVPDMLAREIRSKPPVLLVHGDADPVVPYASMADAETALRGAGVEVESFTSPGTGHGIAPDGLTKALEFILARLN